MNPVTLGNGDLSTHSILSVSSKIAWNAGGADA
jgi:hypothetical protein